jgi:glycyl-tRNA synthetase beta chain
MANYLLEIGTEELPAAYLKELQDRLVELAGKALQEANLDFGKLRGFSTPRRLVLFVDKLADRQHETEKKVKGPPKKTSFSPDGKALPSAVGFAAKHNIPVESLTTEKMGDTEYLVALVKSGGQPAREVLAQLIPNIVTSLSGERMMRWGEGDLKFMRPIRWFVSLLDSQIVPFEINGVKASRSSQGHRTLSPGAVEIDSANNYLDRMQKANVSVDPEHRRALIKEQLITIAGEVSGTPRQTRETLLDEVANITEWPCAIVGSFAKEYLDLPEFLIETVMVHHQRYFPVEEKLSPEQIKAGKKAKLLPYFVAISNNTLPSARGKIKLGNERVLKARLADGRFFYFDDQKTPLKDRIAHLSQLTFQHGLGSYQDKISRLTAAGNALSKSLKLDAKTTTDLERALSLAKVDLVTNLVKELPELEGHVGSWYAANQGESDEIAAAIASHYSPRFIEDPPPKDYLGQIVSLLDKLDNIIGAFMLGRKPSGSSDPYALRRQAQGIIEICLGAKSNFDLPAITSQLASSLKVAGDNGKVSSQSIALEVQDFLLQRLKTKFLESGYKKEIVEAVLAAKEPLASLPDAHERCKALAAFVASETGLEIVRVGVRVANIVADEAREPFEEAQISESVEANLLKGFKQVFSNHSQPDFYLQDQYCTYLTSFRPMVPLIDQFFDAVMINDPDPVKRKTRRGLLGCIDERFKLVADFSKLKPLLN